jgi:hypothetical protein
MGVNPGIPHEVSEKNRRVLRKKEEEKLVDRENCDD